MKKICPNCYNGEHFYILKDEKKNPLIDRVGDILMELDSFEDEVNGNRINVPWYCDNCDTECTEITDFARQNMHKDFSMTIMHEGKEITGTGRFLPSDGEKLTISLNGNILHIMESELLSVRRQ